MRRGSLAHDRFITLPKGEHGRDKTSGSLTKSADCGRSASSEGPSEGVVLAAALLPLAWSALEQDAVEQEMFFGCRSRSSKRRSQSVRPLATSASVPRPGGTGDIKSFERHSSNCQYSSLPRAMPCKHCATEATMHKRQLEGMWSKVFAGSERIR